jgi:hypothetical protein
MAEPMRMGVEPELRRETSPLDSVLEALPLAAHWAGVKRAEAGPADERCHHRLSKCRAPLSSNQKCEKLWALPAKPAQLIGVVERPTRLSP